MQTRKKMGLLQVWALIAGFLFAMGLGMAGGARAASGDPVASFANQYQTILIIATVVGLGAAVFWKGLGQKNRTYAGVVGLVAGAVLAVGMFGGGGSIGGSVCDQNPNLPQCKALSWNVMMLTTYDTDVDVTAEVIDSEGGEACDGTVMTGAIATIATNAFVDEQHKTWNLQSDSDDDVARSAAGFQEIDCPLMGVDISLVGAFDANGDGVADLATWYGKLISVGPATFSDGNQTSLSTVYYDPDFGWECAFLTEGNIWVNAFGDTGRFATSMPSSGPSVPLGTHAGGGAAFDLGSFACVFDQTNGAPTGYTKPASPGNVEFSATVAFGSESDWHTYTLNWFLQTRT